MKNLTRKIMVEAILASGYIVHPCNISESIPTDETSIYYLEVEELLDLYNDCLES